MGRGWAGVDSRHWGVRLVFRGELEMERNEEGEGREGVAEMVGSLQTLCWYWVLGIEDCKVGI